MSKMLDFLPLNRKEKYWTSCVLPIIVTGEKFCNLRKFLKHINVPEKFVKHAYGNDEISFVTEYCLRDAALGWKETKGLTGETPDLVILLNSHGEQFLVFIEAKMFDFVTKDYIRRQLDSQKKLVNIILKKNKIHKKNFLHVALFLETPPGFIPLKDEVVITWPEIRKLYLEQKGSYFYNQLEIACDSPHLISRRASSYGQNKTGEMKYDQIVRGVSNGENFYVGRDKGLETVRDDCKNGKVMEHNYEVNTKFVPGKHRPPGKTGRNWFAADEFVKVLIEEDIIG